MLSLPVLHPEVLGALASAGHASRVMITDGNYPHISRPNPRAKIVWANFVPGVIDAVTALRMVASAVPIEQVHLMAPETSGKYTLPGEPPIWDRFRSTLRDAGFTEAPVVLTKPAFNEMAAGPELCLVIATAEMEIYANVMITIGVVRAS